MVDVAEVGFKVDTSGLEKADDALENLGKAAKDADKATDGLKDSLGRTEKSSSSFTAAITKATGVVKRGFSESINFASGLVKGFVSQLLGFGASIGTAFAFSAMISGARELSRATGELSTNIEAGSGDLEKMTAKAREFADVFGTDAATQVKTFYEAVSAGATSVSAATAIVDTGNRLAIGGLSDLGTAVDVLTTVTNAYSASGITATEVSDSLFIAVKAGKTTVSELASQIGFIAPLASGLGLSFDQLTAATAALTLQGLTTSSAVTSLRAILSGVAKPTTEASKLAKQLGLDFSTTALRTKGLAGFLQDVVEKTGGSADNLSILFGSVEALNGAIAFSGAAGKNFNDILGQMADKAGATNEAFNTIANTADARLDKALKTIGNRAVDFGNLLLVGITPMVEGIASLANGTSQLIPQVKELGIALAIAFAPLIIQNTVLLIANIATLAVTMTGTLIPAIYAAASALLALTLSNPFTALLYAVPVAIAAIWYFRDQIKQVFGVDVTASVASAANDIVGTMKGAYDAIVVIFSNLGTVLKGAISGGISNFLYDTINEELQSNAKGINGVIGKINSTFGTSLDPVRAMQLPDNWRITNQATQASEDVWKDASAAYNQAKTRKMYDDSGSAGTYDPLSSIRQEPPKPPTFTVPELKVPTLSGAAGGGGGGGGGGSAVKQTLTDLQKLNEEFQKLNEPFTQAQTAFNTLQETMKNGVIDNDSYTASLKRIEDTFLKSGGTAQQWGKIVAQQSDDISKSLTDVAKQGLTQLGDAFADLVVDGTADFEQLANSMIKSLLKILWQALILKPILDSLGLGGTAAGGAAGGGPLAAIGGFLSNIFGGARAAGGPTMSGKAYLVGEKGPEIWRSNQSGTVIPNDALRGGGSGNYQTNVYNNYAQGADVQTKTTRDGNGNTRTDITIAKAVGAAIASPGSDAQRALVGTFGSRPQTAKF